MPNLRNLCRQTAKLDIARMSALKDKEEVKEDAQTMALRDGIVRVFAVTEEGGREEGRLRAQL